MSHINCSTTFVTPARNASRKIALLESCCLTGNVTQYLRKLSGEYLNEVSDELQNEKRVVDTINTTIPGIRQHAKKIDT